MLRLPEASAAPADGPDAGMVRPRVFLAMHALRTVADGVRVVSKHKYRAQPQIVDGVRFASKAEARRYGELKMLEKAGEIKELELQPKFPLYAVRASNGEVIKVADYYGDFRYRDRVGAVVVEDVKGYSKEPYYRMKRRFVEAQYGIEIRETR